MKKNISVKKSFIILLSMVMGCSLISCGKEEIKPTPPPPDPPIQEKTIVNQATLFNKMTSSIYTDYIACDTSSGLSDESSVGVDRKELETIKYPVPADNKFAKIYNVNEYGIVPDNPNNYSAFVTLLNLVKKQNGLKKIYFPTGHYRFDTTVNFYQIDDLYLEGEETTEWIMTEWTTYLSITQCKNFHINNIDFDYQTSSSVAGTVLSTDSQQRTVTIKIDDEFDMTNYRYNNGKIKYGNYMEYIYDKGNQAYVPDNKGMLRYNSPGDKSSGIENGVYTSANHTLTLTFNTDQGSFRAPTLGKTVSVGYTMYEYCAISAQDSKKLYIESCNIYASAGMTFHLLSNEDCYLNKANLMLRPGSKRLMTSTADGLHPNDCFGDLIVTNSIYEASHDDSMNICTFYKTVSSISRNVITCTSGSSITNFPTNIGDELEIYNDAMEVVGRYTVVSVLQSGLSCDITVDKRVRNIEEGFRVGNISRAPKLVINNCIFRNKRNRALLIQTQNAEISHCAFYNVIHGAIMLHSAFDIFNEGIIPRNVVVKNNKFWNNNAGWGLNGDVAAFRYGGRIASNVITNIQVQNNFFYKTTGYGVYFIGTGDSSVINNLFYNINKGTNTDSRASIYIEFAANTTIKDNYTYFTSAQDGFQYIKESNATGTIQSNNIGFNI